MRIGERISPGKRFASDDVPLPAYMSPDTVKIVEWDEVIEALRSPHLLQEPPATPQVHGGGLGFINGAEHRSRRRMLNALVRPEPLDRYRKQVVVPALHSVMHEMLIPGDDGTSRVDLVSMLQKVFIQFAATFIGLKGADTAEGRDNLQRVFRPLPLAHHVRFMKEGKEAAVQAAIDARNEYERVFVKPSLEDIRKHLEEMDEREGPGAAHHSVLMLVAQLADPAYANHDNAMADAIGMLVGGIDTSTHAVTNTVDDLMRWFEQVPEDRSLRTDLEFLNNAMEETLRLRTSPPVLGRIAAEDFTLSNGKEIKKGQAVAIYHSLANRDRSVFGEDADQYNPRRQPLRNVPKYGATFGGGSHMCIGQRVVVGDGTSTGSHTEVLKALFEAGIKPDPQSPPTRLAGEMIKYLTYPVIFESWPVNEA